MRTFILPCLAITCMTACVSSSSDNGAAASIADAAVIEAGVAVPTDGYETYVTQHNGFTRVRRSHTETGDSAILAQFEDKDPASPAGFRNLIDWNSTAVRNRVNAEVIGEDETWTLGDGTQASALKRILRLTADVEKYTPANVVKAGGEIVLSGSDYSVVRIGDALPKFANQSDPGALYLALNFDTQTAAIRIINRTVYEHCTGCTPMDLTRVDLLGENLPFNVQTGAFGGKVNGELYELFVRLGSSTTAVSGTLLGQVGGAARDDLVAGGVFEASGTRSFNGSTSEVQVDGIFHASN